jgi:Domain of unknown function (DUF4265)
VSTESAMAKVALRGANGEVETLWAEALGGGRYRLDNTPWYAYGISWRDIVEATPDADGQLQFVRVISKGGNRTVRIRSKEPFTNEWLGKIVALGASFEGADRRLIGINIPSETEMSAITSFLTSENVEWEHADPTYEELYGTETAT